MRRSRAAVAGFVALVLTGSLCGGCGGRTPRRRQPHRNGVTEKHLAEVLDSVGELTIDFTARPDSGTHLLFEGLGGRELELEVEPAADRVASLKTGGERRTPSPPRPDF